MHESGSPAGHVRFGAFELNLGSGELHKGRTRLRVPDQSIEILKALLEHPGELVTREALRDRLWSSDTFVDFEHGLNAAVRRLREALGDSADVPKYIETLPRRGYRFIGTIEPALVFAAAGIGQVPAAQAVTLEPAASNPAGGGVKWKRTAVVVVSVAGALLLAVLAIQALRPRTDPGPPVPESTRLTFDPGLQTQPTFSPDGRSIAYASNKSGNFDIWQQPVAGGNAVQVTTDPDSDWQPDWSPDGSRIAFRSERGGGGIFVVPATGGHEERITDSGFRPRWSRDGSWIYFRSRWFDGGGTLNLVRPKPGTTPRQLKTAVGYSEKAVYGADLDGADGWHPGGHLSFLAEPTNIIRLLTLDPEKGTSRRFSVNEAVQQRFHGLGLRIGTGEDLAWAPDGTALYFVGSLKSVRSVWMFTVDPAALAITSGPHPLTSTGPNRHIALSRDGLKIAYAAPTPNARVWSYALDASGKRFVGAPQPLTPAEMVATSAELTPDGTKLLYWAARQGSRTDGELRARNIPDGPDRLLLSTDAGSGEVTLSERLAPDGMRIAYFYRAPGQAPSPKSGSEASIRTFDLQTEKESQLTSPFRQEVATWTSEVPTGWSPDGRFVISSSSRGNFEQMAIMLLPLSAAPKAETQAQIVTSSTEYSLWNARMSPDSRWIGFNAVRGGHSSRLAVVSSKSRHSKSDEWTWVTDGASWADKPRWSHDGRLIYFVTQEGGLGAVWGIEFDPIAGRPVGRPFQLTRFTGPGERMGSLTSFEMGVSRDRLAIPLGKPTGGIWILEHFKR